MVFLYLNRVYNQRAITVRDPLSGTYADHIRFKIAYLHVIEYSNFIYICLFVPIYMCIQMSLVIFNFIRMEMQ